MKDETAARQRGIKTKVSEDGSDESASSDTFPKGDRDKISGKTSDCGEDGNSPQTPQVSMSAESSYRTPEGQRLHNPLPEPVQGKRRAMEFPIMDTGDGKWPPLSDCTNLEDFDEIRDAREDDFDIRIADADDFDYE